MALKNRKYPHLLPESIIIWERWLAIHKQEYSYFDYDVRVGGGRDPGPDYQPNIRQDGIDLSKRRIDAIGYKPNYITIIEITPLADLKCLGQILAYPILYQQTYNESLPIRSLIVTERIGTDLLSTIRKHEIQYNIV